jgi:2-oxo-3-hexenedioate decarboxylase
MDHARIVAVADRLIDPYEHARTIEPITASDAGFGVDAGYAVLREIYARRLAAGWQAVGRKIGFTNRTIWARYGVDGPMWAHIYSQTVQRVPDGVATRSVSGFVQPRLEPEIVFGVNGTLTDAWPLTPGARWRSEFGSLGLPGMELQAE